MSVAFSVGAGLWIEDRLFWTLAEASGRHPALVRHGLHSGSTFLVARGRGLPPDIAQPFVSGEPSQPASDVRLTSDDWPFLYLRPGAFPWGPQPSRPR